MAFQAFLIALIIFVGKADYFVGTAMLGRPLVLGMLVGIALGDVSQGVIIGFQLELVFMGMQAIGASIPPDMIVGSVLGTAFAIGTGNGIDTAVTIAMPAAILSAFVVNLFYGVITPLMARTADKFAPRTMIRASPQCFLLTVFSLTQLLVSSVLWRSCLAATRYPPLSLRFRRGLPLASQSRPAFSPRSALPSL